MLVLINRLFRSHLDLALQLEIPYKFDEHIFLFKYHSGFLKIEIKLDIPGIENGGLLI